MLFPQTRIIGGNNAQVNEYPYAVSIQDENGHICGGTLIAVDTVLTAAHCSPMTMGKALKDIKVVVGRSDLSDKSAGEELSIRKEKIHTGYNRFDNDFALLFLRSATMMGKVIELNKEATDPEDLSLVIVVGWGDVDESENVRQMANVLQEANLKVVSNEQCNNSVGTVGTYQVSYKGFISDTMMCAWHRKRDSCQGDSGGPLMVRINGGHKQVGLVSWGVGCKNRDFPGVYARVSSAFDWVEKQVCKNSIYPPRYLNCEPF